MKHGLRRAIDNPFEVAVAVLSLVTAVAYLTDPNSGFLLIPTVLAVVWAVQMVVAGPVVLAGMLWRGDVNMGYAVERAGLYLLTSAWATRAVVLAAAGHALSVTVVAGVVIYLGISLCALVRVWAIHDAINFARRSECSTRSGA